MAARLMADAADKSRDAVNAPAADAVPVPTPSVGGFRGLD